MQVEIYEDKDSARKDEIAALGGQTTSGTNVFSAFYDRLKEVISNISLYYYISISELIYIFHMNVNKCMWRKKVQFNYSILLYIYFNNL